MDGTRKLFSQDLLDGALPRHAVKASKGITDYRDAEVGLTHPCCGPALLCRMDGGTNVPGMASAFV